jgi:CRP-like cAMP-binding protein
MILEGQIEIIKQVGERESKVIATLGVGEIVGELAIISKLPRTAGARARGPTRIRILSKTDIDQEMEKLSPWVSKMITGLSGRFIELRDRLLESQR